MNTKPSIDHIVIGANSLKDGVDYLKELLNVDIPFGGEHVKMGTHNHLMRLGDEIFLEVIAVNKNTEPPKRPRWYGLDDPYIRHSIQIQPTLLTWVVNTNNIVELVQHATFSLGKPELISRGNLSWNFALPEDGRLLAGGLLPYAIEWHTNQHPSQGMADPGCNLKCLKIFHPYPVWLYSALDSIDALELVKIVELPANETPYFLVEIETPTGTIQLQSGVTPKQTFTQ